MSEVSAAEKQQLLTRMEGITRFFERNVSEHMTNFIFGDTQVGQNPKRLAKCVKSLPDYVGYINNVLSLAFVFAHGCLRCDNDSESPVNKKATKQSSLRIINSLRKAYTQYPATPELVQFVLSDIQFEMLQGTDSELYELFENLCPFRSKDFSLTKYYKLIAAWRAAPSRFNMNSNELAEMFTALLKNMTFLSAYDLVYEDGGFYFRDKEAEQFGDWGKYSIVPAQHLISFDANEYDMYTLYSIEKQEENSNRRLAMRYVTGDGFRTLTFTVCENGEDGDDHIEAEPEDVYYEIMGEDWNYEGDEPSSKKTVTSSTRSTRSTTSTSKT